MVVVKVVNPVIWTIATATIAVGVSPSSCYSRFPSCHMNGDFPRSDAFENTDGLGVGQTVGGVAIDGKDFITFFY